MSQVLIAVTGVDYWTLADGTKNPSGYFAEEFVAPHRVFRDANYDITIATPGGVPPTVDKASLTPELNNGDVEATKRLAAYIERISDELNAPLGLEDANPEDFDAIFMPGGHGPMEDLANLPELGQLVVSMLDQGKVVSAVCHGPAGLFPARRADGSWAFRGYQLTGFSNAEENMVGLGQRAIWLLEDRIGLEGGTFSAAGPWEAHVVVDRNVVTGQNPASSEPLAREVIKLIEG